MASVASPHAPPSHDDVLPLTMSQPVENHNAPPENPHDTSCLTIKEASLWASQYLGTMVTTSNIAYLINYGRIPKIERKGRIYINLHDLETYYHTRKTTQENAWRHTIGQDMYSILSFSHHKESETTKHVHRLHPYKGKFIPQLASYFLDSHTDTLKRHAFFAQGDIVLDPFCGSGTTLVQANELGMHAIGIDVSAFNAFISNCKIKHYDLNDVARKAHDITDALTLFQQHHHNKAFDNHLSKELSAFNAYHFPSPDYRRQIRINAIDEAHHAQEALRLFSPVYDALIQHYGIDLVPQTQETFLETWFLPPVRLELEYAHQRIKNVPCPHIKDILSLILSRTMRSSRATTHADLGTLKKPVRRVYYCKKHGKICKPLFSMLPWWTRYVQDTIKRLEQFQHVRTPTEQYCLVGDSKTLPIQKALEAHHPPLASLVKGQKIRGIFSSPPYVGLIDYHEQHAYAYDMFGLPRRDALEIGPLAKGQGRDAQKSYIKDVSNALSHCTHAMKDDYDVFLVANDKYNLYPTIAERAHMTIVRDYKRPVLNRVEKNRHAYTETIFHMKARSHDRIGPSQRLISQDATMPCP